MILRVCGSTNVKRSVYDALQLMFDDETFGERLCERRLVDKETKQEIRTPNGGRKLKLKNLPTLVKATMNCRLFKVQK
jgi:hypothetical protein